MKFISSDPQCEQFFLDFENLIKVIKKDFKQFFHECIECQI